MAEGAGLITNWTKLASWTKLINLGAGGTPDVLKMSLVTTAYASISIDDTTAITSLTEYLGANYVIKTLAGQSVTQVDASDLAKFNGDDIVWTSLGDHATDITAAVLWDDSVSDYVLMKWEITTQPNGADYTLAFNANGIATLT